MRHCNRAVKRQAITMHDTLPGHTVIIVVYLAKYADKDDLEEMEDVLKVSDCIPSLSLGSLLTKLTGFRQKLLK